MAIHNREAFLNHLADNLGRSARTEGVLKPEWSLSPQKDVHKGASKDELADILEKQCESIHTDFKRTTKFRLAETLMAVIDELQGKSMITSKDDRHHKYGLDVLYSQLSCDFIQVHQWEEAKGTENQRFAEQADIGLSFSDLTLAESGTIVQFNDRNNGRSISLLPQSYIAIIPKETLVPRITQAAERIQRENKNYSCISFITGPSNSADIEMNLIVGVHGPIKVTYILVED